MLSRRENAQASPGINRACSRQKQIHMKKCFPSFRQFAHSNKIPAVFPVGEVEPMFDSKPHPQANPRVRRDAQRTFQYSRENIPLR